MVHLLIIRLNSKEIDGVPVTGTPAISRTAMAFLTFAEAKVVAPPIVSMNKLVTFPHRC